MAAAALGEATLGEAARTACDEAMQTAFESIVEEAKPGGAKAIRQLEQRAVQAAAQLRGAAQALD